MNILPTVAARDGESQSEPGLDQFEEIPLRSYDLRARSLSSGDVLRDRRRWRRSHPQITWLAWTSPDLILRSWPPPSAWIY
jgi:hypothetical protein